MARLRILGPRLNRGHGLGKHRIRSFVWALADPGAPPKVDPRVLIGRKPQADEWNAALPFRFMGDCEGPRSVMALRRLCLRWMGSPNCSETH